MEVGGATCSYHIPCCWPPLSPCSSVPSVESCDCHVTSAGPPAACSEPPCLLSTSPQPLWSRIQQLLHTPRSPHMTLHVIPLQEFNIYHQASPLTKWLCIPSGTSGHGLNRRVGASCKETGVWYKCGEDVALGSEHSCLVHHKIPCLVLVSMHAYGHSMTYNNGCSQD